jgi:hypothetical protein
MFAKDSPTEPRGKRRAGITRGPPRPTSRRLARRRARSPLRFVRHGRLAVMRVSRTGVDSVRSTRHAATQVYCSHWLGGPRGHRLQPGCRAGRGKRHRPAADGHHHGVLDGQPPRGAATSSFTGNFSHLGATTGGDVAKITLTSPATFTYTGTDTLVAANGDEVFSTFTGSGTFTSATTIESTQVNTITGGTGRFADASGTFTVTISSVVVSSSATSDTTDNTDTWNGQISY